MLIYTTAFVNCFVICFVYDINKTAAASLAAAVKGYINDNR